MQQLTEYWQLWKGEDMFIFGGLKATVSITGAVSTGVTVLGSNQTFINYSASESTNAGYKTVITPTAGKIFYLSDIVIQGGGNITLYIADNGTEKIQIFTGSTSQALNIHLNAPIPISTTCQIKNSAGIVVYIGGVEQ